MNVSPCFDAGSRYCPCELAELGQCVACSMLRGENTCTCGWSGLCVYAEFIRNKKKAQPRRHQIAAMVVSRQEIQANIDPRAFVIDLEVPRDLALWCEYPGSFVLVRQKNSPERFNVPLSVMRVSQSILSVAAEVVGPKTIALDQACREGNKVTVVGPFWSGIQGIAHLRRFATGRVLIVAKGIAQSCAFQTAKWVMDRGGYAKVLLGPGPIGKIFADELVRSTGASLEVLPKSKDHNLAKIFAELNGGRYDVLVSQGSDAQHRSLRGLADGMEQPPSFAWSSNLSMTCAEGICGSCLVDGFRGCKANLPAGAGFNS